MTLYVGRVANLLALYAGRGVGQTIGFCRLSSGPRLTLAKDDRPQKAMVCPTFGWSQRDFHSYLCTLGHRTPALKPGLVRTLRAQPWPSGRGSVAGRTSPTGWQPAPHASEPTGS